MAIKTSIIKVSGIKPARAQIRKAATLIQKGGVVVFPTETVYGIGANAFDEKAARRIFNVKGRPRDNPLIVHVDSLEMAQKMGVIPKKYQKAIKTAWPSPITFIVKARAKLPKSVTAGLETVALRMPAHPVALALIKHSGVPIAAPSANPSKKPSATTGTQAAKYFSGKVDAILDSGECFFGIESSIIDLSTLTLLRPGPFTPEEIRKIFGKKPRISNVTRGLSASDKVISPGTKYAHYSPDTKMFMSPAKIKTLIQMLSKLDKRNFAFLGSKESCALVKREIGCATMPLGKKSNLYEIAQNLYSSFNKLDDLGKNFAVIETFQEQGIGLALMNRIRKACNNITLEK
ncbi:MAG: L-threonylcarbamoyladenylate synthase [Candidatus Micrarchaeales archaeon]